LLIEISVGTSGTSVAVVRSVGGGLAVRGVSTSGVGVGVVLAEKNEGGGVG